MTAEPPDFEAARDHVVREVVRLARVLRRDGVAVAADAAIPAARGLVEVGLDDRDRARAALHATLVRDARDTPAFEEAFPEFWYRLRTGLEATGAHDGSGDRGDDVEDRGGTDVDGSLADVDPDAPLDADLDGSGDLAESGEIRSRRVADTDATEAENDREAEGRAGTYSAVGERSAVGHDGTDGESVSQATMRRFERALATLAGRRWTAGSGGQSVDARRALRESMATGGVAMSLPTRERVESAFRTCVLVDVSRSVLDAVDRRFLLSVLDALVADGRSTRVFFFDTEIRDVTEAFAAGHGDPATVLERAEVAWGGGTRIGGSLASLRRRWPDAVDRRTVTLVVSDGLEVGDIDELESSIAWLARRSRAVVWLNPLATSTAWEPTCRGMEAVGPYVDALFAFGGDADLDDAARQLGRRGPGGPVGYEYDFRDRRVERGVETG
jgi:uncharacterized protein with von Willebrand factor type A (vWA) domain